MKVKTNEIAHLWARGTDKSLTCTSSCEVNGNIFVSYSTPIARRLEHGGKVAFIVDARFFSTTTRKHQALVSRATSNELVFPITEEVARELRLYPELRTFYARTSSIVEKINPAHLLAAYRERARALVATNHKTALQDARAVLEARDLYRYASNVSEFFGADTCEIEQSILDGDARVIEPLVTDALRIVAEHEAKIEARRARAAEERERLYARRAAERAAEQERRKQNDIEARALFLSTGEMPKEYYHSLPDAVRVNGFAIATIHGATISLRDEINAHAVALVLDAIERGDNIGWNAGAQIYALGYGTFSLSLNDERLVCGCHSILREEIAAIAPELRRALAAL